MTTTAPAPVARLPRRIALSYSVGAVGTGIATYSDCDPNCIDGQKQRVKATVRLSEPRSCDGNQFFATSTVEVSTGPALRSYLRAPC